MNDIKLVQYYKELLSNNISIPLRQIKTAVYELEKYKNNEEISKIVNDIKLTISSIEYDVIHLLDT